MMTTGTEAAAVGGRGRGLGWLKSGIFFAFVALFLLVTFGGERWSHRGARYFRESWYAIYAQGADQSYKVGYMKLVTQQTTHRGQVVLREDTDAFIDLTIVQGEDADQIFERRTFFTSMQGYPVYTTWRKESREDPKSGEAKYTDDSVTYFETGPGRPAQQGTIQLEPGQRFLRDFTVYGSDVPIEIGEKGSGMIFSTDTKMVYPTNYEVLRTEDVELETGVVTGYVVERISEAEKTYLWWNEDRETIKLWFPDNRIWLISQPKEIATDLGK